MRFLRDVCLIIGCAVLLFTRAQAQSPMKPAEPVKSSALKLPDGTIVLVTRANDDPDPTVDRVLLTPQEYQALLDKLEDAKKARASAKPLSPASCRLKLKTVTRGERTLALISAEYTLRTVAPKTVIALGGQKAALASATSSTGKIPLLQSQPDEGLTLLVEEPGEVTLKLELEAAVTKRAGRNEVGLEMGLPRSAITTVLLETPIAGAKSYSLGTRTQEPGAPVLNDFRRVNLAQEQLVQKAVPLGPVEAFELTWEQAVANAPVEAPLPTLESDVVVRADESQVDVVARIKLRGVQRKWSLWLPPSADVLIAPAPQLPGDPGEVTVTPMSPKITRPQDLNQPLWQIELPPEVVPQDWLVTVSVRQTRPKPSDPKFRGPYFLGPFHSPTSARHVGKVSIFAPPGIRVGYKPIPDLRRQELSQPPTDDLVGLFQYNWAATPGASSSARPAPWLELDLRPAAIMTRLRPTHRLRLTPAGWRLNSTLRITPPVRGDLEQFLIDVPNSYQSVELGPDDLIDEVLETKQTSTTRTLQVRFRTPLRQQTEMTISSFIPISGKVQESKLGLPRILATEERDSRLTVTVPSGLEVRATAFPWDAPPNDPGTPFVTPAEGASTTVSLDGERGFGSLEAAWQVYRPELLCEQRAELVVQDRQIVVAQVLRFRSSNEDIPTIRFQGRGVLGLQSTPPLDLISTDEWEFRPAAGQKDVNLSVTFAQKVGSEVPVDRLGVSLLWPENITKLETTMRIWGQGSRRALRVIGPWRELPPQPLPEKDSIPWFTLASVGTKIPLDLVMGPSLTPPRVVVERAQFDWVTSRDSSALRCRWFLSQWPSAGVEMIWPADSPLELLVEGKRVDPIPDLTQPHRFRIPLDGKTGSEGLILEARLPQLVQQNSRQIASVFHPELVRAEFRQPVRWTVTAPQDDIVLSLHRHFQADHVLAWRSYGLAQQARGNAQERQEWFLQGRSNLLGQDLDPVGHTWAFSTHVHPSRMDLVVLPRLAWQGIASGVIFVLGFIIAQMRARLMGLVSGILGMSLVIGTYFFPQPVAEFLLGAQYGVLLLLVVLGSQVTLRWWLRRRVERLPGFTRNSPSLPFSPSNKPISTSQNRTGSRSSAFVQIEGIELSRTDGESS